MTDEDVRFFESYKIYRQNYEMRIKPRASCAANQVHCVPPAKNPFIWHIYVIQILVWVFHGTFPRGVPWSRPLLSNRQLEKSVRTNESQRGETSCIGRDGRCSRALTSLSRMHDQFPVRKYERYTFLPLSLHISRARKIHARYVTALSVPHNEALLRWVATGPLQLV